MKASRLLRSTALVVPFALTAAAADAADLVDTIKQTEDLGTFSKAIQSAGMSEQLKGEGPYTVFAPSDAAFDKLPQDALDRLMQGQNQAQLQSLLAQHMVEGKEIAASDVVGQQTKLSTLEGEQLTVDGTSQAVILVPTGLQITRVGDRIVVERETAAVTARSVEVRPTQSAAQSEQSQQQGAQGQQTGQMSGSEENPEARASQRIAEEAQRAGQEEHEARLPEGQQQGARMSASEENPEAQASQRIAREADAAAQQQDQPSGQADTQQQGRTQQQLTPLAEGSDVPVTEHQQEALKTDPDAEQQQTAEQASVPSTEHQRQVIRNGEPQGESQQQAEAGQQTGQRQQQGRTEQQQTPLAEGSDMPATEHQQEALKADPGTEQQQTAEQASVPSTEHQRQVIRNGEPQGDQGVLREAQVVRPDIQADNGVIHIVDAVLVPQKVLSMLESGSEKGQQQKSTQ